MVDMVIPEEVSILTPEQERAVEAHRRILVAQARYNESYIEMAEWMYRMSSEKLYRCIGPGYSTIADYVEKELDMSPRKAEHLASFWWWYAVEQKADPTLMAFAREAGWTKARMLVRVVDVTNVGEWSDVAKRMSSRELEALARLSLRERAKAPAVVPEIQVKTDYEAPDPSSVPEYIRELPDCPRPDVKAAQESRETKHRPAGAPPPSPAQIREHAADRVQADWKRVSFDLTQEHREAIDSALDHAMKRGSTESKNQALYYMAVHFLSFADDRTMMDAELLRRVETVTGLSLIAIDSRREDAVVYGSDVVARLAGGV
jgi:hypothetical protein